MEMTNEIDDDVFDSSFNSIEFDGFLSKIEGEIRKRNNNPDQNEFLKYSNNLSEKQEKNFKEMCIRQNYDINKGQYHNVPDLIHHNVIRKNEIWSIKNGIKSCLSPINDKLFSSSHNHCFSSTPIKKDDSLKSTTESGVNPSNIKEGVFTKADYEFFDADLFEDWGKDDICPDISKEKKSLITLSQALKLLEQSEQIEKSEEPNKFDLNESVDLLTGKIVSTKVNETINLFEDSFNLSKFESVEKKINKNNLLVGDKNIKDYEVITLGDSLIESKKDKSKNKPSAAQKLNFGIAQNDTLNYEKNGDEKRKNSVNLADLFDDSFDILTQDHVSDDCKKQINGGFSSITCSKTDFQILNNDFSEEKNFSAVKENLSDDLSDESIIVVKKKGRSCKIYESDSEEDSYASKFMRPKIIKKKKWNKGSEDTTGRQFIESEAEVSDTVDVSSDENESDDDKLEESFLDEGSYFTQNISTDMTAKYLESVKAVNNHPGTFKIPVAKPYDPATVFSQFQPDTSTDYEIDSFCVNDLPNEEEDSGLQDLEIAEKVLEMNRKKRKKKHKLRSRKIKRI